MANFWPTLMTILLGLGILLISFVLQTLAERRKYQGRIYSIVKRIVAGSFNFVIVQLYGCLDDILFDLILDIKTNPFNTFFSWVSLFCAFGFLAIGCGLVFMNMRVVYKYQIIKIEGLATKNMSQIEVFNERNKYWELFYSEFNDQDFFSQSALAFFIVRSTLSSLTITVFYDYPLMQTSFLVILDGAVMMFLIIKKPFVTLRGKLAQYYFETVTFLVHISTFILALQDTFPTSSESLRSFLCTSIIYLNTILVTGGISFMSIEIYDIIRLKTETNKYKQPQEVTPNHLAIEENPTQNNISSTQQISQIITTTENLDIRNQRKPNKYPVESLESLATGNNNRSFSGMMILRPERTFDLSMNTGDESVLQDFERSPQRNRSPMTRPRKLSRTPKRKPQQQQQQSNLFLRNPNRHIRDN